MCVSELNNEQQQFICSCPNKNIIIIISYRIMETNRQVSFFRDMVLIMITETITITTTATTTVIQCNIKGKSKSKKTKLRI